MTVTPDWVSAVATSVTAAGVVLAFAQLKIARNIAQSQFEDGLSKEYRELANRIPTKALLGAALTDKEYECTFDELFRYLDLSNEQVSLRQRGRVGLLVWQQWRSGIQSNLTLPAFERAWLEVQAKSNSFVELRRLQREGYKLDPRLWKEPPLSAGSN